MAPENNPGPFKTNLFLLRPAAIVACTYQPNNAQSGMRSIIANTFRIDHQATSCNASSGSSAPSNARVAIYSGRGASPYFGAFNVFSTLLYTMNTLARGQGEMLPLEPCMVLQSKNTTEPALPVIALIPPCSASNSRLNGSGTPYSCAFSDFL